MTFWIAAAALTLVTVAAMLWPLFRREQSEDDTPEYDLAVYRDQLAEVEQNLKRGLIGEGEAKAARTEIHRRILAADQRLQARSGGRTSGGGRSGVWSWRSGAAVVGVLVPLASVALYLDLGSPDREAMPLASRDDAPPTSQMATGEARTDETAELASQARQLAGRLETQGGNLEDWVRMGRMRMALGQYDDAAMAFETARGLAPEDPIVGVFYAEALVMAQGGMVTPQARQVLEAAAERAPEQPRINYYLALADMQAGRTEAALERWAGVARQSDADAPWLEPIREQMARAERDLGIEPGTTFRQARAQAPDSAPAQASGPTREQMEAAGDMSSEDRAAMIDRMVERLAARLEENPDDVEGWRRLARAYSVLDRPEKAADAMAEAAERAPENVDILAQYARTLRAVGGNERVGESLRVSQRILELDPDNPEALWFVAMYELARGNQDTAGDMFDRALAQLPEDSEQRRDLRRQADRLLEMRN